MDSMTTAKAMEVLRDCLAAELSVYTSGGGILKRIKLRALLHSNNECNIYCITYVLCSMIVITLLLLFGLLNGRKCHDDVVAALGLLIVLLISVSLALYVLYMCTTELVRKSQHLISLIGKIAGEKPRSLQTPPLHCPITESVELCWTYRDGCLVNLPSVLLVPGDKILLRPGRPVVCQCQHVKSGRTYAKGEMFLSDIRSAIDNSSVIVKPLEAQVGEVLESPATLVMRTCHMYGAHTISPLERQYDYVVHGCLEKLLVPTMIILTLLSSISHYMLLDVYLSQWVFSFISSAALTLSPLLLPALPVYFTLLKFFNSARLLHERQPSVRRITKCSSDARQSVVVLKQAIGLFLGSSDELPFTSSLYPILGSVTTMAVINKRGILSYPDRCVEKIFFFKQNGCRKSTRSDSFPVFSSLSRKAHVMDVSQNVDNEHLIHFDDDDWQKYLANLKPFALNAELSGCNVEEEYGRFMDHIKAVAVSIASSATVVNRRCFCPLTQSLHLRRMGRGQFRHPGTVVCAYRKRTFHSDLAAHRFKGPVSCAFGTVHREESSVYAQMMCHGSADLLLQMCQYYWDGHRVKPMQKAYAKRILEFSSRHNMTAYCMALSYRPLPGWMADYRCEGYYDLPLNFFEQTFKANNKQSPHERGAKYSMDSLLTGQLLAPEEKENVLDLLFRNHIFLGMMSFQYQIMPEVVNLVEQMDKYCIRFVHFSKENELRSRVFAEKMGLEAGWNCHISLQSDDEICRGQNGEREEAEGKRNVARSFSSAVIVPRQHCSMPNMHVHFRESGRQGTSFDVQPTIYSVASSEDSLLKPLLGRSAESPSCTSEASVDLSLGPSIANAEAFLLTNRARLPKGIENVRPHLENVDNVPLLVSLFTDCNANATREMVEVMQENGEVVCVVGSSLSPENCAIFCRANVAISFRPLLPCNCSTGAQVNDERRRAVDIAHCINSLPCSLSVGMEKLSLQKSVKLSRHMLATFRVSLFLFLAFSFSLFLIQLLAMLFIMPRPFSSTVLVWQMCGFLPCLCAAVALSPLKRSTADLVTFKDRKQFSRAEIKMFFLCFLVKFAPSCVMVFLLFRAFIYYLCERVGQCKLASHNSTLASYWQSDADQVHIAQSLSASFVIFYFVVLSGSYVFCYEHIWKRLPFTSVVWTVVATSLLLFHGLVYVVPICLSSRYVVISSQVPWYIFLVGSVWPIFAVCINELTKHFEIVRFHRDQRRRRLSFDTKLGMNSPF